MIVHKTSLKPIGIDELFKLAIMEKKIYFWTIDQTIEALKESFTFDYDNIIKEDEPMMRTLMIEHYIRHDISLYNIRELLDLLLLAKQVIMMDGDEFWIDKIEKASPQLVIDACRDLIAERWR